MACAVGAGGAQQLHPVGPGPEPLELGQQRGQDGAVGHRPGEVGEDHRHPVAPARPGRPAAGPTPARPQRRDAPPPPRRPAPAGSVGLDHHRVVGHLAPQAVGAVGQVRPHQAGPGPPGCASPRRPARVGRSARARAAATRSAAGRSSRSGRRPPGRARPRHHRVEQVEVEARARAPGRASRAAPAEAASPERRRVAGQAGDAGEHLDPQRDGRRRRRPGPGRPAARRRPTSRPPGSGRPPRPPTRRRPGPDRRRRGPRPARRRPPGRRRATTGPGPRRARARPPHPGPRAGCPAARPASSSGSTPVRRPSQARNEPAADSPPSSSQPPSAPRESTSTRRGRVGSGRHRHGHRHVGGGPPADHGPVDRGAGARAPRTAGPRRR